MSYLLDFPNEEVRSGMTSALAADYFGDDSRPSTWLDDVSDSLEAGDLEKFKLNSTSEVALRQIDEKDYALPYAADVRKIYKVGVSFSSETGTVNDFDYSPCE